MALTPIREILTCLDASGSVGTHAWDGELVLAYNDYIDWQQGLFDPQIDPDDDPIATSLKFTYESLYQYNKIKLHSVPNLTFSGYESRGITSLWDSMGLIINGATNYAWDVNMAVFSDSFDNASHIYSHSTVKSWVQTRDYYGWNFDLYTHASNTDFSNFDVFDYFTIHYI